MKVWMLLLLCIALAMPAAAQVNVVPGSVVRGERVLNEKACLSCHALNGRGGNRAPDFAGLSGQDRRPAVLAIAMWNHSPRMWTEFEATQRQPPRLTSLEAADLFAYFYATLYFAPKGDGDRGKTIFQKKGCANCHSEVLATNPANPLLTHWTDLKDPISWAERMWNHGSEMVAATSNKGVTWPTLSSEDIVDLTMFLSKLPATDAQSASFSIGEPERGRLVFERSCESCHSFGQAGKSKVNLSTKSRPASVTDFIAAMWNHAPAMRRRGGATPQLNLGEMGDLIGFLFAQRYFLEEGNSSRGRRVFVAKGCVGCHESRGTATGAPNLAQVTEVYSPITLTSAVWQHGPSMLASMKQKGIAWPQFRGSEMVDLIAYLNSQLIRRIGGQTPNASSSSFLAISVHFLPATRATDRNVIRPGY